MAAHPCASADSSIWGRLVVGIQLQCDANLKIASFPDAVTQKIGEALDPQKVDESLKRLYATGRFTDLRAEGNPVANGVELVFVGRALYFVGIVRAEGDLGPLDPRAIISASRLRLGDPLSDRDLTEAHKHIADLLASNGYYQARLSQQTQRNTDTQEANVFFSVSAGKPAHLSAVQFEGQPAFTAERLRHETGWHVGDHLTSARVERGLFRLHNFYMKHGRLQAIANISKRIYDPKQNTEKLIVTVDAGPPIQVRVKDAKVSFSKLKNLLPIFKDGVVDETALSRSSRILEDHFQQNGYFSASVKAERSTDAKTKAIEITFRVTRGRRGEFAGYEVKGNKAISTGELMATVNPPVQGLFPPAPAYSRSIVEQKISALKTLYQSKGYLNVQVTPSIDDRYQGTPGYRLVTFEIQEDGQTTVRDLKLTGLEAAVEKDVQQGLLSTPGKPYSPENAQRDRDYILNYLADRGYTHASAVWHPTPAPDHPQVDLEFRVVTGSQERINRILILGNTHTRVGIIRRELVIQDGEPLAQGKLLDSQRRLYEVGVFNQVQITTQELPPDQTERTVLVGVEESKRWTVGYGGGVEVQRLGSNEPQGQFRASPRLSLDVTRLNVGGRGQTFAMRGRLSTLESGGGFNYLIPRVLTHRDLNLRLTGLVDRSRDVLTFTSDRREASVSLEKHFSPSTVFLTRYSFRIVQALDFSDKVSEEQKFLLSGRTRVGMMSVGYVNDHRNNPADATEGSYSVADAGASWQKFGSEADFLRLSLQNATYYRLGTHLVFARNTQLAFETPFGGLRSVRDPATGNVVLTHQIPLPERLFMGGSDSHRGFSINQAGPRDPVTGFPLGGNALFLNNLELRIPLAERNLGFAFFHDAGNVYSTIRRMRLFKVTQNSPTDLDYTVHAVGFGIRYRTPVGPLRIDMGYDLNPPRFQVVNTVNGINTVEVRQLSHFQFFLSVGQSF